MSVDFYSPVGKVRLTIGDFTEPFDLPDAVIIIYLEENRGTGSDEFVIYQASLSCLQAMIADASNNASRLREREGGIESEEYRKERYEALKERYDYLVANPPSGAVEEAEGGLGSVLIGGVSCKERNRIRSNPDNIRTPTGVEWFEKDGGYEP